MESGGAALKYPDGEMKDQSPKGINPSAPLLLSKRCVRGFFLVGPDVL